MQVAGYRRNEQWRALTYLELQRMLLLMYTSCGWFFNDISGIETIQILKYAARAIDLMDQLACLQCADASWKSWRKRRVISLRWERARISIDGLLSQRR